jgi:hypothetical protein
MVHARHSKSWSSSLRWLVAFETFAKDLCASNGMEYSAVGCRADNELCRLFLVEIAEEKRGISRPVSARRALSGQRVREGSSSLTGDADITRLIAVVRNSQPSTPHQVESLGVDDVELVASSWGMSSDWVKRQIATVMAVGFYTIVRLGELLKVRRQGVRLVFRDPARPECSLSDVPVVPEVGKVAGVLIHLAWRKSRQDRDAWVPLSVPSAVSLVLRQEMSLRELGASSPRLFPSNARGKGPHVRNHLRAKDWVKWMRRALVEQCRMDPSEARVYAGHSLRVGGSTHMRRCGVDEHVHRSLGGWASLTSAAHYIQLSPTEQFAYTRSLATCRSREAAVEGMGEARHVGTSELTPVGRRGLNVELPRRWMRGVEHWCSLLPGFFSCGPVA